MRVAALITVVLAGCGDPAEVAAPLPAVDLPTVEVCGAPPSPDERLELHVTADGTLHVGDRKTAWADLPKALDAARADFERRFPEPPDADEDEEIEEPYAGDLDGGPIPPEEIARLIRPAPRAGPARGADGAMDVDVLLRIDRTVPWPVVARLLQACAHPRQKFYRLHYAVAPVSGDRSGALAVFLPKDKGISCGGVPAPEMTRIKVHAKEGTPVAGAGGLATRILQRNATPATPISVSIRAGATTSYGDLIRVLEAAVRARAISIDLEGPRFAERDVEAWIRAGTTPAAWMIRGRPLMARPAQPAEGPGVRDGFLGTTNALHSFEEEIEEDLDEAPGDG